MYAESARKDQSYQPLYLFYLFKDSHNDEQGLVRSVSHIFRAFVKTAQSRALKGKVL